MNRGFTLVELLAVIIILSLLVLITSTVVTKVVKDAKRDISSVQKALIESAAKTWGSENIDKLPSEEECIYLTLEDLKNYGLIDSSIIDSNTGKEIPNDTNIKISATSSNNMPIYTYEVGSEDIDACTKLKMDYTGVIYGNPTEMVYIGESIGNL